MCRTCGCNDPHHHHDHVHAPEAGLPVPILQANDAAAARVRGRIARAGVVALNVVGAPGAGKTALLETTIARLPRDVRAGVIVADLATDNDARRLRRDGVPVLAIETGTGCHLTAPQLERELERFPLAEVDLLFVENVGNLVCPALFDLGEEAKVLLVSTAEGTDKPEKYPVIVRHSSLLLFTKLDLLPHVDFDVALATTLARRVHPEIEVLSLSARTGEGLGSWIDWIGRRCAATRNRHA